MLQNTIYVMLLSLCISVNLVFAQLEEKKEVDSPKIELPEVMIFGENESKILPVKEKNMQSFDVTPKLNTTSQTSVLETQEKIMPQMQKFEEGKNRFGEITTSAGNHNIYKLNTLYGMQIGELNYFVDIFKYKDDGALENSGNDFQGIALNTNYKLDTDSAVSLDTVYDDKIKEFPFVNPVFHKLHRKHYFFDISAKTGFTKDIFPGFSTFFEGTSLTEQGYDNIAQGGNVFSDIKFFTTDINHSIRVSLGWWKDSIFNGVWNFTASDYINVSPYIFNFGFTYSGSKITPNLDVYYGITRETTFYFKYKPELYYPKFSQIYTGEYYFEVNPNLQPSWQWLDLTLGAEHIFSETVSGTFEVYRKEIDNYIIWDDTDGDKLWTPLNVQSISEAGMNFTIVWKILPELIQTVSYNFISAFNNIEPGKAIPYLSRDKLKTNWQYLNSGWEADLYLNVIGARPYTQSGTATLPAYVLLDTQISKEITNWLKVFFAGENLLNRYYEKWFEYPELSATFRVGLTAKF
ncbi:MAG: TonB-dependent receptor [Candidatus Firestonebacteria bacterium]